MKNQIRIYIVVFILLLSACSTRPIISSAKLEEPLEPVVSSPSALPIIPPHVISPDIATLKIVQWNVLPGWKDDDIRLALKTFLHSCSVLKNQKIWARVCKRATSMQSNSNTELRKFFEHNFKPYQVINSNGSGNGLITGYYEPLLKGSRKLSERYRFPIYTVPKDLLNVDLGALYPQLKNSRVRGRLEGQRVVPYYSRAEIEADPSPLRGYELLWVEDAVELFFLQIQGSGRIETDNGEIIRVGYHNQNGYSYQSIGKLLVKRGELPLNKASMEGIKAWGLRNPGKLKELLHQNPSYVFFRELPANVFGPIGALGVPLTAGRSIAIDPRAVPQGAPIFLSTTWPNSHKKLNRLMVAQDTGGAIKGGVRGDFFWGFGKEAAKQAGRMRQIGKMWVFMPSDYEPRIRYNK
tara:strand:+ start:12025 stop:13251 length:1227 start_codon:yes stop_codon:yes gene_type:complete